MNHHSSSEDSSPIILNSVGQIEDETKFPAQSRRRRTLWSSLESSPVVPIRELALFPPMNRRESSAIPETNDKSDQEDIITWRVQKRCGCRQSKCLKLYCDCFASRVLCSDCDCADCHNNSEENDAREAAMLNAAPDAKLGLLSRGCKCKRTKCLKKKHCECFQANVLCSDKCKCINCKNVSENSQPLVVDWGLNNRKLYQGLDNPEDNMLLFSERSVIVLEYINNINAALGITSSNRDNVGFNSHYTAGFMNHVPGFSAHSSPQVYQMRRFPELLEWNAFPASFSSIPYNSIPNALEGSHVFSFLKLPYRKKRSRLGNTITLPELRDICSHLFEACESATSNAEDQNLICIKPDDNKEDNKSIESESHNVEEETQSCGRLIELIDAQYNGEEDSECKTKNSVHEADTYMEQEKAVLETFRDWLKKFNNTIRFNS